MQLTYFQIHTPRIASKTFPDKKQEIGTLSYFMPVKDFKFAQPRGFNGFLI
jgi:hypothetical protein